MCEFWNVSICLQHSRISKLLNILTPYSIEGLFASIERNAEYLKEDAMIKVTF